MAPRARSEPIDLQLSTGAPWCRFTCWLLMCQAYRHLSHQINNLQLELLVESGPWSAGWRSQAGNAKRIRDRVAALYQAKVTFKEMLEESPQVDSVLEGLSRLLKRFESEVMEPLKQLKDCRTENAAKAKVKTIIHIANDLKEKAKVGLRDCTRLLAKHKSALDERVGLTATPAVSEERSIVSVDMSQYGRLSRNLEETLSVQQTLDLNLSILKAFDDTIRYVGLNPADVPLIETGDGAILLFKKSIHSVKFAERLLRQTENENTGKSRSSSRHYRIGICTGEIMLQTWQLTGKDIFKYRIAGVNIATAVRLQAKAKTGEILICHNTWAGLPAKSSRSTSTCRRYFPTPEGVMGKSHEEIPIQAYRRTICQPAPWDKPTT